jgi:biotin carboxyl carrier protein
VIFPYLYGGESHTVQLEQRADGTYRAVIGEREVVFRAEAVEQGWALAFPESGAHSTVYIAEDGDSRSVHLQGETYTLTRETTRRGRRSIAAGGHGGDVTAQMPGQVREVLVVEGQQVERGQVLVILEAMKMEVRATAPADGSIKRLLVAVGDVVSRGQLLAVVE